MRTARVTAARSIAILWATILTVLFLGVTASRCAGQNEESLEEILNNKSATAQRKYDALLGQARRVVQSREVEERGKESPDFSIIKKCEQDRVQLDRKQFPDSIFRLENFSLVESLNTLAVDWLAILERAKAEYRRRRSPEVILLLDQEAAPYLLIVGRSGDVLKVKNNIRHILASTPLLSRVATQIVDNALRRQEPVTGKVPKSLPAKSKPDIVAAGLPKDIPIKEGKIPSPTGKSTAADTALPNRNRPLVDPLQSTVSSERDRDRQAELDEKNDAMQFRLMLLALAGLVFFVFILIVLLTAWANKCPLHEALGSVVVGIFTGLGAIIGAIAIVGLALLVMGGSSGGSRRFKSCTNPFCGNVVNGDHFGNTCPICGGFLR